MVSNWALLNLGDKFLVSKHSLVGRENLSLNHVSSQLLFLFCRLVSTWVGKTVNNSIMTTMHTVTTKSMMVPPMKDKKTNTRLCSIRGHPSLELNPCQASYPSLLWMNQTMRNSRCNSRCNRNKSSSNSSQMTNIQT